MSVALHRETAARKSHPAGESKIQSFPRLGGCTVDPASGQVRDGRHQYGRNSICSLVEIVFVNYSTVVHQNVALLNHLLINGMPGLRDGASRSAAHCCRTAPA